MPKILAVDDDICILELYTEIFTKAGFEIKTAEDALSAVTRYQEFKPDLVVLDVEMPAGGGQKVFDLLRRVFLVGTPILFSTGKPESVERLGKNYNVSILKKPVDPQTLISEVKKLLKMPQ